MAAYRKFPSFYRHRKFVGLSSVIICIKLVFAVKKYVSEFGELMQMHYTCGPYHNQCQPDIMPDEGKKFYNRKLS